MRNMIAMTFGVLFVISATAVSQAPPRTTSAVDITKGDIEAVLKHTGKEGAGADRQIKVVDLGKYNVGVGILQRGATKEGAPVGAITHAQVTEVYYIISGGGTLVTGGTVMNPRPFPSDGEIVKIAVGPSTNGTFQGGERRTVSAGDVVIIPAGIPHGFDNVKDQVTYLSVRPDPDHVLPAGYVHPAIRR